MKEFTNIESDLVIEITNNTNEELQLTILMDLADNDRMFATWKINCAPGHVLIFFAEITSSSTEIPSKLYQLEKTYLRLLETFIGNEYQFYGAVISNGEFVVDSLHENAFSVLRFYE